MEGGVVTTDDEELYHIMLSMRSHGWTRTLPKENLVSGTKSDNPFEESFKFVLPGYNLRPVEMSGAIGIEQLKKLPAFISQRRKNADYFIEKIRSINGLKIQKEIGDSSWFGFSIVVEKNYPRSRDELVNILQDNNIDCRPIVAGNFAKNPVVEYMDCEVFEELTNADFITENGFFVGNHHVDMKNEIDYLYGLIK
jgi:CDP-6-deoxy-D-xylo-4-hexulose-3-dehydrase